jgi:DnaK suppressor protein
MATAKKTTKVTTTRFSEEASEKLSLQIIKDCKERLIAAKEEVLNTLKINGKPPEVEETIGDFGDQNTRAANEHQWFLFQNRLRKQLVEIESALYRVESGVYGI